MGDITGDITKYDVQFTLREERKRTRGIEAVLNPYLCFRDAALCLWSKIGKLMLSARAGALPHGTAGAGGVRGDSSQQRGSRVLLLLLLLHGAHLLPPQGPGHPGKHPLPTLLARFAPLCLQGLCLVWGPSRHTQSVLGSRIAHHHFNAGSLLQSCSRLC